MESIRDDPELAQEMVVLLGRELKNARKTIEELTSGLVDKNRTRNTEDPRKVQVIEELKAKLGLAKEEIKQKAKALDAAKRDSNQLTSMIQLVHGRANQKVRDLEAELAQQVQQNQRAAIPKEPVINAEEVKELKVELHSTVKRIDSFKTELAAKTNETLEMLKRAEAAEKHAETLQATVEDLGYKNQWLHDQLNYVTGVKKEEDPSFVVPTVTFDEFKTTCKLHETIQSLEAELATAKEMLQKEREHGRASDKTLEGLEMQVARLSRVEVSSLRNSNSNNTQLTFYSDAKGLGTETPTPASQRRTSKADSIAPMSILDHHAPLVLRREPVLINLPKNQSSQNIIKGTSSGELGNADFEKFMSQLKVPKNQLDKRNASPILNSACSKYDLANYLKLLQGPSEFLYFPKCFKWEVLEAYHGLAFGPFKVFDHGRWREETAFPALHGQTLDFFYTKKQAVYYGGKYKCHHTRSWFPEGVWLPLLVSPNVIVDASILQPETKKPQGGDGDKPPLKPQLWKMYADGDLKVDCLALECVGFDHAFYSKMLRRTAELSSKRQAEDPSDATRHSKRSKK